MEHEETLSTRLMMVVSVGGTPDPILFSLNQQRPDYVVYFCSAGSRHLVAQEIRPRLDFRPTDEELLTTESAERLVPAYVCARDGVRRWMRMWNIDGHEVVVDYTGGTKNMSAALALATIDLGCGYSYVGGREEGDGARTKGGLGVVLGGREKMFYPANPWEVLGVERLKEVALLFNRARYAPARERLAELAERVPAERRPLYRRLAQVVEGFERWDRFDHKGARAALGQALGKLHESIGLLDADAPERTLLEAAAALHLRLAEITPNHPHAYVADLVANAVRRAELEQKYEDAVARLYAAVEKLGKFTLRRDHRLDNSRLDPDAVPEALRDEYQGHYWSEEKACLQIPLRATYRLLSALGDPLGARFEAAWPALRPLLDQRNNSILGHGTRPVSRESYEALLAVIHDLLDLDAAALPTFPRWEARP